MIVIVELVPPVVAATGLGENDTLVLAGLPVALSVTELGAPVTVMVIVPELPRCTVRPDEAEIVKSGTDALTVTVTVVECGPLVVPVPVMVNTYVPGVAVPGVTLNTDVTDPPTDRASEDGVNVQVALAGHPVKPRATVSAKPFMEVTVMVELPAAPPCVTDSAVGFAEIVKSGVAVEPQPGNLKEPIAVLQLKEPLTASYMFVYQNVQSSLGSMRKAE